MQFFLNFDFSENRLFASSFIRSKHLRRLGMLIGFPFRGCSYFDSSRKVGDTMMS